MTQVPRRAGGPGLHGSLLYMRLGVEMWPRVRHSVLPGCLAVLWGKVLGNKALAVGHPMGRVAGQAQDGEDPGGDVTTAGPQVGGRRMSVCAFL